MNKNKQMEEIKKELKRINKNIIILDLAYVNSGTKMRCKCLIDNHTWPVSWSNLKNKAVCPKCKERIKKEGLIMMRMRIKELRKINPFIKINSKIYVDSITKLNLECLIDGYTWDASWKSLKDKKGCPLCANRNSKGGYNLTLAERHKEEWANINATVYIIRCYGVNEKFYKIGITKSKLSKRFDDRIKMPYKYDIVNEIKTNLYNAIYLENDLHESNKEYSYAPLIKFGGYTECFSQIIHNNPLTPIITCGRL